MCAWLQQQFSLEAKPDEFVRKSVAGATEVLEIGYGFQGARRILAAAREFQPDVIYERHSLHCDSGLRAARALGIPLLLEVNSPALPVFVVNSSRLDPTSGVLEPIGNWGGEIGLSPHPSAIAFDRGAVLEVPATGPTARGF